jgi:hypothetical protein
MTVDLDALKEALAKMTPGVWQLAGTRHSGDLHIGKDTRLLAIGPDGDAVAMVFFDMQTSRGHTDAAGIVLLRSSAEAMIARIEALEAENARLLLVNRALRMQRDKACAALKGDE